MRNSLVGPVWPDLSVEECGRRLSELSRVFSEHLADASPERLAEEVAGARSQLISEPPVRSLLIPISFMQYARDH